MAIYVDYEELFEKARGKCFDVTSIVDGLPFRIKGYIIKEEENGN